MRSMLVEKARYLEHQGAVGGTAKEFRDWVKRAADRDPGVFPVDALRDEAATRAWEAQPRKKGPDLFSVAGLDIPQFLTRRRKGFTESDVDEESDLFEKIDSRFAIVDDYIEDAVIKLRNAAKSSAAAEKQMQHADECLRLARFNRAARLRDLADKG